MKQAPLNLHELLHHTSYDNAVICTYTFDPEFFEEYCLDKFNSLKTNGNISVIIDNATYYQAITGSADDKAKQANLRYLLHPIDVPGRFHTKIFLFTSRNKGRLIFGSANFTRPGITSNAEMINYYDYETEKKEEFKYLFQSIFIYLNKISIRWPSNALISNLKSMERESAWLMTEDAIEQDNDVKFIHNMEIPLWEQIKAFFSPPVDAIYVLSRFFDANTHLLDIVKNDLKPKKVLIFTQNGITTLSDEWLRHKLFKEKSLEIYCCTYKDDNYIQNLHAKSIIIKKDNRCLLAFGSANFTTPALIKEASKGNAESLIILMNLPAKDIQPLKLFDPLESAYRLRDDGTLKTAQREVTNEHHLKNKISLNYAELVGDKILVKMTIEDGLNYEKFAAKIQFHDEANSRIGLHHNHDDEYYTDQVNAIDLRRLGEKSSTMIVEANKEGKKISESNPLLIINLLDIKSGKHVRRERYIREAQQGTVDFFRVLESLIKEGDEEPLITFFTYCDIPILDISRPFYSRGMRPVWDGGKGMKNLGEKNLAIFHNLHDAAMSFYTRHFKKLQRHAQGGGINSIANYLHIYLAMGGVLRSQIERLMQGLQACQEPISSYSWGDYRQKIDIYFIRFKELMSSLNNEYLPNLLKVYKKELLRERFDPDLQPIKDLYQDMLAFQSRMEFIMKTNLKLKTPKYDIIAPRFFRDDIFQSDNWSKYKTEQDITMKMILIKLAA